MKAADPIRLELLAALAQLSHLRPEWRLGQTLANVAMTAGKLDSGGVWDLEDAEALAAIRMLIDQYADRTEAVGEATSALSDPGTLASRPVRS